MPEPSQPDHYRTLGVPRTATRAHIKATWTRLLEKIPSDSIRGVWGTDELQRSLDAFGKARSAYETLIDIKQRKRYDAYYDSVLLDHYDRREKVMQAKRLKRSRFSQVLVKVQSASEEFHVHGEVLRERSLVLQNMLAKASINENNQQVLNLTEQENDVMAAYIHFAYHGTIDTELSHAILNNPDTSDLVYEFLAKLYIFADKFKDDSLCNAVIDALSERLDEAREEFPGLPAVRVIYDGTSAGSPARRMLIEVYAFRAGLSWSKDFRHTQFEHDLLYEIMTKGQKRDRHLGTKGIRSRWYKK